MVIDAELMPWSAKAGELLLRQYAAVGSAAEEGFGMAVPLLAEAEKRGVDVGALHERVAERASLVARYRDAYRRYCWEVAGVDDLRLAGFHLLASEGAVHVDQNHRWHMEMLGRLAHPDDPLLVATSHVFVDLDDADSEAQATRWWEELTAAGGEGMVIKPLEFVVAGRKGLVQPAVKCRGPEYLRIIYGPEYTLPENLARLRERSLGLNRSLAVREFALGVEALERFVRGDGLHRVHECVFGVLALESEPVDPRL